MKKNGFVTFCCACVPGAGQMYQGYMKRGVSLMFWFFAVIAISVLLRLDALLMFLVVIWAYSFFDTFNLRNLSPEQRATFTDTFIPSNAWVDRSGFDKLLRGTKIGVVAGWVLVGVGVVVVFQNLWNYLEVFAWNYAPWLGNVINMVPRLIIGGIIILLGIYMLRGSRKPPEGDSDDAPDFKGGDTSND